LEDRRAYPFLFSTHRIVFFLLTLLNLLVFLHNSLPKTDRFAFRGLFSRSYERLLHTDLNHPAILDARAFLMLAFRLAIPPSSFPVPEEQFLLACVSLHFQTASLTPGFRSPLGSSGAGLSFAGPFLFADLLTLFNKAFLWDHFEKDRSLDLQTVLI